MNFRQYILQKVEQTKKDKKTTKLDTLEGKKKGLSNYQKGFYDARVMTFKEVYDECKRYEWGVRK